MGSTVSTIFIYLFKKNYIRKETILMEYLICSNKPTVENSHKTQNLRCQTSQ